MPPRSHVILPRVLGIAVLCALVLPAEALGHTLNADSDLNRPLAEYLWLGIRHMIGGWDHLLFIAGAVLLARRPGPAAKLVSLFVAGHSLTLLVATLAGWHLDPTWVDIVIALSVIYIGFLNLRPPGAMRWVGATIFAFGLVHGLGLSTRLQALGLPEDGVVVRVLLFNVGIEIGQLTALAVIVTVGTLVARRLRDPGRVRPALGGAIVAAAVVWLPCSAGGDAPVPPTNAARAERGTACTEVPYERPQQALQGGHPAKVFFAPGEPVREGDLQACAR